MKFAVGYQRPANGESFADIVRDYRDSVEEVYFAWPGLASGRTALGRGMGGVDWSAQAALEDDLLRIRSLGARLDLLFNANCYGAHAVSEKFEREIGSLVEYLAQVGLAPDVVTTASPFVAAMVKKHFPGVETRASVNMRLDSTLAMEYLADVFDAYHLRRDRQRDLGAVARFHEWCQAHGKRLCLLANSGCLRYCPAQTFHDNLVAHDAEVGEVRNVRDFAPHLCWKRFARPENMVDFLRGSWIRPEDLARYEPYLGMVKLATRLHSHPRVVIGAYTSGRFRGNVADLTEPCFSQAFSPYILDNERFPDDWPDLAAACAADCRHCGRCEAVLERVRVRVDEELGNYA